MKAYRKLLAALIGAATSAASAGLLPAPEARWVPVVVAFLTAAGVYATPNR